MPGFKTAMAWEPTRPVARVGGRVVTAREVARAFLRELFAEVKRETGDRIRDLVATVPVDAYEGYPATLPCHSGAGPGITQCMAAFHAGEIEVQARLLAREDAERVGRIVGSDIPSAVRPLLRSQRMAVAASLDAQGRPWASILTGPADFIQAADERLLRIGVAPLPGDPLAANLQARPELGLLVIDPRTRRRLRFNGRGLLSSDGLFLLTDEVYGNCPKYIQKRRLIGESEEQPGEVRRSSSLDERTREMVSDADTFFIATWHPEGRADASHRGGRPGFVQVVDDTTLQFPDYPGNNMFNTLGNLTGHPRAGLLFVDFERGDLLQITGRARILWEPETAVRVTIEEVRETPRGSPLRFELVEPSPVNPPLPVTP